MVSGLVSADLIIGKSQDHLDLVDQIDMSLCYYRARQLQMRALQKMPLSKE